MGFGRNVEALVSCTLSSGSPQSKHTSPEEVTATSVQVRWLVSVSQPGRKMRLCIVSSREHDGNRVGA